MTYYLGSGSLRELKGVHPHVVRVVKRGIRITPIDFGVHDGLRRIDEQREYLRSGVSTTMHSFHLPQDDRYGHAVDLVPYVNGKLRWEWEPIYKVMEAIHQAAGEEDVLIRWGGVWDRVFNDLDPENLKAEVEAYVARRQLRGKEAFIDGPHIELYNASNRRHSRIIRL